MRLISWAAYNDIEIIFWFKLAENSQFFMIDKSRQSADSDLYLLFRLMYIEKSKKNA